MNIVRFTANHVEDAAALALGGYLTERAAVRALPPGDDYRDLFTSRIAGFTEGKAEIPAFAALERGKLVGFLAGYPTERFFSSYRGVYVPLHGNAAAGDKRLVCQRLYAEASGAWVRGGRLMHAVSIYAHDRDTVDAWYWLGFGLRCVDAIRSVVAVGTNLAASFDIRKATPADAESLYPLHAEHCGYYRNPPLFMPNVEIEDSAANFKRWLEEKDNHLWAAYAGGKPISYMRVCHGGMTFVADDSKTVNVCGAYTLESARGTGAGALLLQTIVQWAGECGYERLGVDYESFNVMGSRFWLKHFTPFQLSVVRFIDDRILE